MSTHNIPLFSEIQKDIFKYPHLSSDLALWLIYILPMSKTNFYGPKDVWAIEVRLYSDERSPPVNGQFIPPEVFSFIFYLW